MQSPSEAEKKEAGNPQEATPASSLGKREVPSRSPNSPKLTTEERYDGKGTTNGNRSSSEDEIVKLKEERDAQGYKDGERKKGVLRKLHLHKV